MKCYAIILLFFYQFVIFRSGYIWVEFQLNRTYIAKNLCENKTAPVQVCGGKCYLTKKLKQSNEAPKNSTNDKKRFNHNESISILYDQINILKKITNQLELTFSGDYLFLFKSFIQPVDSPPP
ncbi:hypothetical protein [Flexithrix dorotheae]|uniref:hypothetical protein n=1 Tax=Flexithrix dorotheae TaxID=70993 RepID=UPI00037D65C4|nr:hypothetical protein [Flexithrix dorotheae]